MKITIKYIPNIQYVFVKDTELLRVIEEMGW